mgnify:CR=1 FL=1
MATLAERSVRLPLNACKVFNVCFGGDNMFLEHGRHSRFLLRCPKALGTQVQRPMGVCQAGDIA